VLAVAVEGPPLDFLSVEATEAGHGANGGTGGNGGDGFAMILCW